MKRTAIEFGASALAFTTVLALTGVAHAQDAAPAPAPAAGGQAQAAVDVGGGAHAGGGGGMTLPGEGHPARAAATGDSDHDQFIGTFAVGFFGIQRLGIGQDALASSGVLVGCAQGGETCLNQGGALNGATFGTISAPVIGVRYWVNEMIGIDAGIGLGINSLGGSTAGGDIHRPSSTAFVLHGGVPLALASAGHFTFEVIPELNLGFSSWSLDQQNAPTISGSGFHFDIGGRIGGEIHFGFIGIPNLALQGTVGLLLATDSTKLDLGGANGSVKFNQTSFGTTLQGDPWNIFTGNITALYYF